MSEHYSLRVNGATHDVRDAWVGENLLYVLRERLGFPGAKSACEQGECGACSVFVGGALVCACLTPAATVGEAEIVTVEANGDELDVVQQAFVDAGAVQCGFCTPGLILAVRELLVDAATPRPFDVLATREAISGNLCRCTGYGRVLAAIELACERHEAGSTRP